jgi:hypothetical protein
VQATERRGMFNALVGVPVVMEQKTSIRRDSALQ